MVLNACRETDYAAESILTPESAYLRRNDRADSRILMVSMLHPQTTGSRAMTQKQKRLGISAGAVLVIAIMLLALGARGAAEDDLRIPVRSLPDLQGEEVALLTAPPMVPAAIDRDYATKVLVTLDVIEKKGILADGVEYDFWTFGGTVPGSFIRVREGDLVEFKLTSAHDSKMPHNIDLHAVTGQGGGAEATIVAPGGDATFSFRAVKHRCAWRLGPGARPCLTTPR